MLFDSDGVWGFNNLQDVNAFAAASKAIDNMNVWSSPRKPISEEEYEANATANAENFMKKDSSGNINLANGYSYLSFETEDQYIYEHLFLDRDLNPLKLQDIQSRMSLDEIQELLLKIRDIIVSTEIVPKEINKIINNNITKK